MANHTYADEAQWRELRAKHVGAFKIMWRSMVWLGSQWLRQVQLGMAFFYFTVVHMWCRSGVCVNQ